jgi:hypothetical protein
MQFLNTIPDALGALQGFLIAKGAQLPPHTQGHLTAAMAKPSPVERLVGSAEALYAAAEDLDADGRIICAQLAQMAAQYGFYGMESRGVQIAQAMRRMNGEAAPAGSSWPAKDKDPAALAQYLPAPPLPILP